MNVLAVDLSEQLDVAGFWHVAVSVGERLGARRGGAAVYRAEAGRPIWPYHYHHGVEEWLYVVSGAPVLREPAGKQALAAGDLVCFPSGPLGAHTVCGPGRFVIFATGQASGPWLSVYPDSDKVSGPEGIHLRSGAVGYWHGEGTAGSCAPDEPPRDLERPSTRPVVNVSAPAGELTGGERFDATIVELTPGEAWGEYRYAHGREQWLLVLAGAPALRHPEGEAPLEPGDLLCLLEGPAGAHQLLNRGATIARALVLSTTALPVNVHHLDSGRWILQNGPEPAHHVTVK